MVDISVIMPAHNVAEFVGEALDSLLKQDRRDFELIAVDDGSSDRTGVVLEEWRGRFSAAGVPMIVHTRARGGAGSARNAALDRARGRLLCFLDADDRLQPAALRTLCAGLDADPAIDLVFAMCRHIDPQGRPTGVASSAQKERYEARDLLFANPIHSGTGVVVRRARAEAAGRFDTRLPACIDVDYWVRLTAGGRANIRPLAEILVDYRLRPGQITSDWRRMRRGWEAVNAKAAEAGYGLTRSELQAARARQAIVYATAAYKHGDMASARRLALESWQRDPRFALGDRHARIRTAACIASLLPPALHDRIRDRFNAAAA